ncbi:hypothetical protein GCM10007937_05740 [Mesorhizobium albiziae]|nr:hypothetical protein GCM10007937_05740 [Mesorhizobium albiziae]
MVWTEKKNRIAIEVQHSSIGLDEIERRSFSYAEAGIAQIWIPFLPKDWVERKSYSETEERFNLNLKQKPFEIWIHGLNKGYGAWYYDAEDKKFYFGMRLDGLTIVGPYDATELELFVTKRHKFVTPTYTWPAAYVAHFRPLFGLRFWHKTIGDIRNQIREERTRMQLSILQARRERVSAVKSMAQRREEAFEHRPKFISAYFQDKERPEDKDVGLYWFDR